MENHRSKKSPVFTGTPAMKAKRARRIPVVPMKKYPSKPQMEEFLAQIEEINSASQRGRDSKYLPHDRYLKVRVGEWDKYHWSPSPWARLS